MNDSPPLLRSYSPLRLGPVVDPRCFAEIRTRLAIDHYKWDLQVGDRAAICSQPLLIDYDSWRQLTQWSEKLAAETTAAESELMYRPELHRALGLPASLVRVLRRGARDGFTPGAARVMRFDFHFTTDGWRVSEVNSAVPGGFTEASALPRMVAALHPYGAVAGDPLAAWVRAMHSRLHDDTPVALLSAPGYLEDQQVTALLAAALQEGGVRTHLIHRPEQLAWSNRRGAYAASGEPLGAVVRFYQAEWICRSPRRTWERLFVGGETPVSNCARAVLSESKRFLLASSVLGTSMSLTRELFPPTADPRQHAWYDDESWVVKGAFSNTGDEVFTRDRVSTEQ